jgi:hypothetical protein
MKFTLLVVPFTVTGMAVAEKIDPAINSSVPKKVLELSVNVKSAVSVMPLVVQRAGDRAPASAPKALVLDREPSRQDPV